MGVISLTCPNCKGKLQMDDSLEKGFCQYCGSEIIVKEDNITNVTNNVTSNNISNSNVTIINDKNKDFEIKACELLKYNGESDVVTIPEGVKKIGSEAFTELNITKVICPKSLVEISTCAFQRCTALKEIVFQEGLKYIYDNAFDGCWSLKKVEIPEGVIEIAGFNWCTSIEEIKLPKSLKKIGYWAFEGTSLKKIELPEALETIEMLAFKECKSLEEIKFPESLKKIKFNAFERCTALKEIELPESLEEIGEKVFYNCSSLEKITFGCNLKDVDFSAFDDCTNLKIIEIPESMDSNLLKSLISYFKTKPGIVIKRPDKDGGKKYISAKTGCYVATCVYGSYDCPEVWTLRRFRDNTLANTWYGRAFIKLYYAISPTIVKLFGNTKWFKKMWKGKLDKLVTKLQNDGVENTPYNDKQW